MNNHDWQPSKLGHGEVMCARCFMTNREAALLGSLSQCGFPDNKSDLSGLDDGPFLPGRAPRKKPAAKSADDLRIIRSKAWATRRARVVSCKGTGAMRAEGEPVHPPQSPIRQRSGRTIPIPRQQRCS